ncbi:MAG TPA: helix-turn-helix domain-containing protein [Duganella sp.]|uniref:helix-turn-helix domain-containing protein n=1 Tax=Duganella sp. TaxID=1904440 RepID=UPI002ED654DC
MHNAATPKTADAQTAEIHAADIWLDMPAEQAQGFAGALATRAVGALTVSQVAGKAYRVRRQTPLHEGVKREWLLVAIQCQGGSRLRQLGRDSALAPGDIALYSTAQPYRLEFDGAFRQTVIGFPAAPLRALCPAIDGLVGRAMSGRRPQVALLAAMAECHFETDYGALPDQAGVHAVSALSATLAGCAVSEPVREDATRSKLSQYHLQRLRQFAMSRLGDSELSVRDVAVALNISTAHIHRLFSGQPHTFSAWLWHTRLQQCHLALANPAFSGLSISQIAFKYGFAHASHFSRAYRAQFGITPSARRQASATTVRADAR